MVGLIVKTKYISVATVNVLAQTFKDYEVIIVGGYSPGNTKEVLAKYNGNGCVPR